MNKILLIGNGSTMLSRERRDLIDSYETVVRFNSYKIKGYEEFVGTKTDIWFTCNLAWREQINSYKKVIFHSWANEETCKLFKRIRGYRDDVQKISKELIHSIPIKSPSTGLIAIYHFDKMVDIVGFDWWKTEKHHYGDREKRGTLHKPKEEYEIIKSLGINILA